MQGCIVQKLEQFSCYISGTVPRACFHDASCLCVKMSFPVKLNLYENVFHRYSYFHVNQTHEISNEELAKEIILKKR